MSPPHADNYISLYNNLPLIQDAYSTLRKELKTGPTVSNNDLLLPILQDPDVRTLFHEGAEAGLFGIWVVHKHYRLEQGERMVSTGNTTKPSTTNSSQIPERWDHSGNAIEFLEFSEDEMAPHNAPSAHFAQTFQDLISTKFGVSGLGICLASRGLAHGSIFIETTYDETRTQVVDVIPIDQALTPCHPGCAIYQSAWKIAGPTFSFTSCSGVCTGVCRGCIWPLKLKP